MGGKCPLPQLSDDNRGAEMYTDIADNGWIGRSLFYLAFMVPVLLAWIVTAYRMIQRRSKAKSLGFFLTSIPVAGFMYVGSFLLFFGGPPPGPRSKFWLDVVEATSLGWGIAVGLSALGSMVYGITCLLDFLRVRMDRAKP